MSEDTPVAKQHGVPPALLNLHELARLLKCSERHVLRLKDKGQIPRPLRLGILLRWRKSDIEDWLAAGCPRVRTSLKPQK